MADNNYVAEQVMLAGGKNFASQEAEESVLYSLLTKGEDVSSVLSQISEGDFYYDCAAYPRWRRLDASESRSVVRQRSGLQGCEYYRRDHHHLQCGRQRA